MASTPIDLGADSPQIELVIEGQVFNLADVGKFMQRLDTALRNSRFGGQRARRIELVELAPGSIRMTLRFVGVLATTAALASDVSSLIKDTAPVATAARQLIQGDDATVINIYGGEQTFQIGEKDVQEAALEPVQAKPRMLPSPPRQLLAPERIVGPQTGTIVSIDGERWIKVDSRPGMILRIEDERAKQEPRLQEHLRYSVDGEAEIGPEGRDSFFALRHALLLT